jgi:hypothetical protein
MCGRYASTKSTNGGRRPTMTPAKLKAAQQMYDAGESTLSDIAEAIGVSRASLYRHLDPERVGTRPAGDLPSAAPTPPHEPNSDFSIALGCMAGRLADQPFQVITAPHFYGRDRSLALGLPSCV